MVFFDISCPLHAGGWSAEKFLSEGEFGFQIESLEVDEMHCSTEI
jgi:hypothetical protein